MRPDHRRALRVADVHFRRLGRAPGTSENHLGEARRLLRETDKPVRRLTRANVTTYLAALERLGLAPTTQARALSSLRAFCRALVEEGLLATDPTEGLRVERPARRARLLLSVHQVERLLAAALELPPTGCAPALALRDRALLELLYGLGLRSGEARALRVTELDLQAGTAWVAREKGGRSMLLPLPPAAVPHLRRYVIEGRPRLLRGEDGGRLLLSARGRPLAGRADVRRIVAKVGQRAGIALHPHALRRAVATHLVEAGVSVRAVQAFLGHHDLTSTELYLEVRRAQLRRAVEVLERR